MITQISDHIRFQSRRLLFAGTLAYLSGFLLYGHVPGSVGLVPVPLMAAALYALATMAAALLTTWVFPRAQRMIDAFAVTRMMFGLWVVTYPTIGHSLVASPLATASIVVGGAVVLLTLGRLLVQVCLRDEAPAELQAAARSVQAVTDWLDHLDAPQELRYAIVRADRR